MRWDRVSLLIKEVEADLIEQGYFMATPHALMRVQSSIVRTNCMDCLDRTNVVQSILAKRMLNQQLNDLGISQNVDEIPDFDKLFRHGALCSL